MNDLAQLVAYLWTLPPNVVVQAIGIVVQFIGFCVTAVVVYFTLIDRPLQRRRIYLDLEFEASRIFRVCIDHPEIIACLESTSGDKERAFEEKTYWYVCQCLNAFEIMISFRNERMVSRDLFATWVAWFHELGTYARFEAFWRDRYLWAHYKEDLQQIMNLAVKLRKDRPPAFDELMLEAELKLFHRKVGQIFKDSSVEDFLVASAARNARNMPA